MYVINLYSTCEYIEDLRKLYINCIIPACSLINGIIVFGNDKQDY